MHITLVAVTPNELFQATLECARELSARILKLSDLKASPLNPGETADARRHQIAKLGKSLAETFIAMDQIVKAIEGDQKDVTAGQPPVDDSNTN